MGDIGQREYGGGWQPSVDAASAPPNSVLRADNAVLDEQGIVCLRAGAIPRNGTAYSDTDIRSLYSVEIGGTHHVMAGCATKVVLDDTELSATFDGSGDIAFGAAMGQMLAARGSIRIKHDGTTERTWGIIAPTVAPTVEATDLITTTIATFDDVAGVADWTAEEGAVANAVGHTGVADTAAEVTPAASGRGTITKELTGETNYYDAGGSAGGPADLIDFLFYDAAPEYLEFVELAISCNGDTTEPFESDYYVYKWEVSAGRYSTSLTKDEIVRWSKKQSGGGEGTTSEVDPTADPSHPIDLSPLEDYLAQHGYEDHEGEQSTTKGGSPGWHHYTIPRGRMERIGSTTGKDWRTVKAIRLVVKRTTGQQQVARFDNMTITSGGGHVLTGTYRALYRYAYKSDTYVELSPASPISDPIVLKAQAITLTIPDAAAAEMDTQCNEVWFYLYRELLGGYFRTPGVFSLDRPRITAIEFDDYADGAISANDRLRLATGGLVPGRRWTPGESSLVSVATETVLVPGTEYLYPAANDPTDPAFTPINAASTMDACDDDHSTPDDTNYVVANSSKAHRYQRWTFGSLSVSPDGISSVVAYYRLKGTGVAVSISPLVRISGVDYFGTGYSPSAASWADYSYEWTTNPATGAAWSEADVNGLIAGLRQWKSWEQPQYSQFNLGVTYTASGTVTTETSRSLLKYTATTSDVELLQWNIRHDSRETLPPDDIISIAGPWVNRWFCLTASYLHPSLIRNPGLFKRVHALRVGDGLTQRALWLCQTTGGLYIGTTHDIGVVGGTWNELDDETLDYSVRWLNVGNPPIDGAVAQDGNTLVYHAADGYRALMGETSELLRGAIERLYDGYERYGVPPLDHAVGRHRAVLMDGTLSYLAADTRRREIGANEFKRANSTASLMQDALRTITGGLPGPASASRALHRYDITKGLWYRHTYPNAMACLCRASNGELLAGDSAGYVWRLDVPEETSDNGTAISLIIWSPELDGGRPLSRKEAQDLQIELDSGGTAVDAELWLDGQASASLSPNTSAMGFYKSELGTRIGVNEFNPVGADGYVSLRDRLRVALGGLPGARLEPFRRAQLRIASTSAEFKLRGWSLAARDLPQHRMAVDTGYVMIGQSHGVYVRELRVCALTPATLTVQTWLDGALSDSSTITASPGVRIYRVPLPREIKGRQLRVVLNTTAAASADDVGFECFWIEARLRPTGGATQKPIMVWSVENTT